MSLTKKDLANKVSRKLGFSQKNSLLLVKHFFKVLIDNKSSNISINNFGSFSYKKTPKRIGRNPKTLEEFVIKPRQKLTFKPSEEVKQNLN